MSELHWCAECSKDYLLECLECVKKEREEARAALSEYRVRAALEIDPAASTGSLKALNLEFKGRYLWLKG